MAIIKEALEDQILEQAAICLNTLQSKGIFTQEDIDAILNDESLIVEDLVQFIEKVSALTEDQLDFMSNHKIVKENAEILEQATKALNELKENGELTEDEFNAIIENDDLTIDDIKEFVTEITNTQIRKASDAKPVEAKKVDPKAYAEKVKRNKAEVDSKRKARIADAVAKFQKKPKSIAGNLT
jgi:uncharacterized protein YllA (UPF0747 family)